VLFRVGSSSASGLPTRALRELIAELLPPKRPDAPVAVPCDCRPQRRDRPVSSLAINSAQHNLPAR